MADKYRPQGSRRFGGGAGRGPDQGDAGRSGGHPRGGGSRGSGSRGGGSRGGGSRDGRGGRGEGRGRQDAAARPLPSLEPLELLFATGNANKLRELRELCGADGVTVTSGASWRGEDGGALPEVVEDAPDFVGNALLKAASAARLTGLTALADDSGLAVDALAGAPGVHSARFAGEPRDDQANIDKLLHDLRDATEPADRRARFVCALVLCGPAAEGPGCGHTEDGLAWRAFLGEVHGHILHERTGEGGFGYDPVFFSPELGRSFGEADAAAKHSVSHRGRAFGRLNTYLTAWRDTQARSGAPLFLRPPGLEALAASLAATFDGGLRYANKALERVLAERPHLGSKERAASSRLHWYALRNLSRLQLAAHVLDGAPLDAVPDPRALRPHHGLLLASLTLCDVDEGGHPVGHRDPGERSALDGLLARRKDLAERLPFPRKTLGKALRAARAAVTRLPEASATAVTAGVQPDFLSALREQLGEPHTARLLDYMGQQGPPTLRVRPDPVGDLRPQVIAEVERHGVRALPASDEPAAVICLGTARLTTSPLFHSGTFEMQDAGSQRLAALAAAQPGERVADWCAGAGGKTLALAASMAGKGSIVALDIHPRRLGECKRRVRRAGVADMVQVRKHHPDAGNDSDLGEFDCVLVDAPCSSAGALRRTPELRWHLDATWLERFPAQQMVIALRAAARVKPGGRLVYATCSVLRAENEDVRDALLKDLPGWTVSAEERIGPASAGYLATHPLPAIGPDGFYAVVLTRPAV